MEKIRICKICGVEFMPDKYHPRQEVCSNKECQHKRQIENQRKWRKRNPEYFKYKEKATPWERKRAQYLEKWREEHKGYFKEYHQRREAKQKSAFLVDK